MEKIHSLQIVHILIQNNFWDKIFISHDEYKHWKQNLIREITFLAIKILKVDYEGRDEFDLVSCKQDREMSSKRDPGHSNQLSKNE